MSLDIDEKRKEVKNGKEYIKPTNVNIKRHDQVNKKKTATEKNDVDMKRHDQVNKKETATAKNDVDMKRHDQENKKETATAKNDVDMKRHDQVNKKETATEKKEVVKKSQGEVENGENANETEIDETMAAHTGDAFIAGWVGGAASVLVSHPLDTVKVRLQTNTAYKGAMDCAIKTFTKEGVRGFYKGMSFPLASAAAYNALVFGIYSNTTKLLCYVRYGDSGEVPRCSDIFIAAMAAG
uniref:Mitochondrial carrier protein n=1 Tax=Ciona savignyi TaxID=51511 RepID=H2ZQA9_CIOSA